MKKFLTAFLCLFWCISLTQANPIDEQTAQMVGGSFLMGKTQSPSFRGAVNLSLVYKGMSKANHSAAKRTPATYYYVFNVNGDQGFVIVAGDDDVTPILAYSNEKGFRPSQLSPEVAKWLEGYKSQIRYAVEKRLRATPTIAREWQQLKAGTIPANGAARIASVAPLMKTKWNQSPFYNSLCPGGSVTGCVATAMAQIMKFWNYPANGTGFYSYNHSEYGTLSANFGATTYQWNAMPNEVSSANNAVATLMYHCGVSVDMSYSPESSGAYVIEADKPVCSEHALKTYFGYQKTLKGVRRDPDYSDAQWFNLLKAELDAGRPILYAGWGNGGGHCFVADGYDANNFVHFNWGWGGAYDGFFSINALNPDGVGTGGGTGGFNNQHQAVIGIQPPSGGTQTYALALTKPVTPSASSINYGQAFTVTTNLANTGAGNFSGDYCAAIFDNSSNFVDFVETKTGFTLQGGKTYTNNLVFSNNGLLGMLPGTYTVGIFYRPTGGDWIKIANSGANTNFATITVINSNVNDMQLNKAMTLTPGDMFTQGASASVNLNLVNKGTATFTGEYAIGLYNLDGTLAQTIATVEESEGLPAGYTYLDPFLTFETDEITAEPGSYLLAILHKATGGEWELTGAGTFKNPIEVTVQVPAIQADAYENNNTSAKAFKLPVTFANNTASVKTQGSTCHVNSDYDYYRIDLPAGADYTLRPRLHDSYNSGDGKAYTLDALFSYSFDNDSWSDTYDDVMDEDITVEGGGSVYLLVSPYFAGETGSYLLDVAITRSVVTGVEDPELSDLIVTYPNPANEIVNVDLGQFGGKVQTVSLINGQGLSVYSQVTDSRDRTLQLPVANLSAGLYVVQMQSDKGMLTKKVIVRK